MKKFIRDAASLLGFPWSAPVKPTTRSTTSSGFIETISDTMLKAAFNRNVAAHAVVADVAQDAVTTFTVTDAAGNKAEDLNEEVQLIFAKYIDTTMAKALMFARLYGHCGILIGYADNQELSTPATGTSKIMYLQAIPKNWISNLVIKTDESGGMTLPPQLDHYTISINNTPQDIDATRLIHIVAPGLEEESLTGESSLQCIYDDLTVLKSMSWGFGQAAWRHGGGLTAFVAPNSTNQVEQISAIDEIVTDINAMTVLTLPFGTQMISETPGSLNPKDYFETCLQAIAIGSRIPVSILRGSVAGSLTASEKDRKDYYELLDNIQKDIITPALEDIIRRFQKSGQITDAEFLIAWDRTPVWAVEVERSKLIAEQAELTKAKAAKERATTKTIELEYKDIKEQMELWEVI